jgi:glycolate oxidase iron-sulfur subunit
LNCRNCESACPSGVEYGQLLERARSQIEQKYKRPLFSRIARDLMYRRLLPYPGRLAAAARVLKIYQRSGVAALARGTGILRLLGLQERERLMPQIDSNFFFSELGKTFPAKGPRRARVALFAGCIAQVTFSELNRATIRVLQANGCEIVVPRDQVCCGALAAHAGIRDVARNLARTNQEVFLSGDFDAIITNAAGCGSTLKEYPEFFAESDPSHQPAEKFSAKVRAVPGVELVEMPLSEQCCGSAGVYNVTETEASMELLAVKMENAGKTKAQAIVTANPGCILQLRAGAAIHNSGQEVMHVVELLDRAMT